METGGVSWGDDLERYQHQRRDVSNWPVPDPNPRTGPMSEIDPYRGSAGVSQQAKFGPEHGRDTLRNEFHDPQRQRAELEAESRAAQRTILRQVPGSGPFTGGLRQPPRGENNREGREHLFDTVQHRYSAAGRPTDGLHDPRGNPDSWIGTQTYHPNRGRRVAAGDARDKGQPLDSGRRDLFTVIQPEGRARDPDDRAVDNWMGNPGATPTDGRGRASAGLYVSTSHHGRRDLFAVVSGRDPGEEDRSKDQWLGNMLYDPNKTRARTDSVEDSLGQGLTVKPGAKEKWECQRMRPLEAKGQLEPIIKSEFYKQDASFMDPEINRGPKKIEPPPAPSGRTSFYPVIEQDPSLKDDFGPRRRGYVKEPGSDSQPGKGNMLLYSNEYCSTLAKRGVVE